MHESDLSTCTDIIHIISRQTGIGTTICTCSSEKRQQLKNRGQRTPCLWSEPLFCSIQAWSCQLLCSFPSVLPSLPAGSSSATRVRWASPDEENTSLAVPDLSLHALCGMGGGAQMCYWSVNVNYFAIVAINKILDNVIWSNSIKTRTLQFISEEKTKHVYASTATNFTIFI